MNSWLLRITSTGWPLSIHKHPYATLANWASAYRATESSGAEGRRYAADLLPNCVNNAVVKACTTAWYNTGNPDTWSNEHQPAGPFVAYMVTGSWYYMSELAFVASQDEVGSNESYRGFSKGLIDGSNGAPRAKAWVLREIVDTAWLLPDSNPLKSEYMADANNAIADFNATYSNNANASPLHTVNGGVVYPLNGGKDNGMPPWQHSFLTWSAGHAAELGFPGAATFRDWLAQFDIGLMTDWQANPTHGYCWLQASAYAVQVKDAAGHWLPSYTAVYAKTFPTLVGLACNSPAMLSALEKLQKTPRKAGEMSGYSSAATGFPSNAQIGLATAADTGLPHAREAWALFESRSVKPTPPQGYNDYPNFAVLPRSTRDAASP